MVTGGESGVDCSADGIGAEVPVQIVNLTGTAAASDLVFLIRYLAIDLSRKARIRLDCYLV
jgi:hypothetical protein